MKSAMKYSSFFLVFLFSLIGCASGTKESNEVAQNNQQKKSQDNPAMVVFTRQNEPNENAFTFLVPVGWNITGGITRVNPSSSGGSGNSIEAKLYMKVSESNKKAEMGWLPDTRFFDMHRNPGQNIAAALFPDGSNYNGMTVMSLPDPVTFIKAIAFPFAHPHAQALHIKQVQSMPTLAEKFSKLSSLMLGGYSFSYTVVITTLEYTENGNHYLEKMVCAIEDWGQLGGGLWSNKETWYVRAVKGSFEEFAPIFATIGHSVKMNPDWIAREIRSQQVNNRLALNTQQAIAGIDKEIAEHRERTNTEINNDMYLNLTGQEDFTNPFTGENERGSNEWNYRWENEQGDVIYHNDQNYNPNEDVHVKVKGYKRSEIQK